MDEQIGCLDSNPAFEIPFANGVFIWDEIVSI